MDREEIDRDSLNKVLAALEKELGTVYKTERECPAVYYLSTDNGEFYVVWSDAADISNAAKKYGNPAQYCPEVLLYPMAEETSGWKVVQYEAYKFRTMNKLPMPEEDALVSAALYGAEHHPEYFGTYPVPTRTPWGYTLRHQALENGIYWIETSRCRRALTVCFPIWQDLSPEAENLSRQIDGVWFFDEQTCCIPVWELIKERHRQVEECVDKPALMNAVWKYFPEYAVKHNSRVQQGLQDREGLLVQATGIDIELTPDMKDAVSISPQAGIDFLRL